jgi:hypothetical protein
VCVIEDREFIFQMGQFFPILTQGRDAAFAEDMATVLLMCC